MKLDKYELELLKDIESDKNIEQVDNYEDEVFGLRPESCG